MRNYPIIMSTADTPAVVPASAAPRGNARAFLSKGRYLEFVALFEAVAMDHCVDPQARDVMVRGLADGVRRIMNFDPDVSTYTASHRKSVDKWRARKAAETGQSNYGFEGGRAAYDRANPACKPKGRPRKTPPEAEARPDDSEKI